ncbi:toxin-antitoxin system TumE family protein [Thermomonas fusca]|uniref:toxin-antitoxin system TumE family protein n=1 Tax=Thermomonas fusca TaxID=215690 RepID=UPI000427B46C|nr:DUF6516 family protein [Thermomonas fusca]
MPSATRVLHEKFAFGAGVVELIVWQVPKPVPPSEHPFKYRMVYLVGGARIVGYDNERGKGDHKHLGGDEQGYTFTDVATLIGDFWNDVKRATP